MSSDTLIMVVDDQDINLKLASNILSKEYTVRCVRSGALCLGQLSLGIRPDLILLDIHMPNMDGFQVMEQLYSNPDTRDIPVIFLTADSENEAEIQGFELGAFDFIKKPFIAAIMMKRIERVLELSRLQKNLQKEVEKQTAVAEERRRRVEEMSLKMVDTLAVTLEAKDAYTNGHSSRVAEYAVMIAREMGWDEERLDKLQRAGLLHDIGKIGVPDSVLNKPGRLDNDEFATIKSHTTVGSDILSTIESLDFARIVARHHHERYDGKGYPDGLAGEEIPIEARVVCVADTFDAMSSKRIYRDPLPKDVIRAEIIKCRGSQFDPEIDDLFIKMFDRGDFDPIAFSKG